MIYTLASERHDAHVAWASLAVRFPRAPLRRVAPARGRAAVSAYSRMCFTHALKEAVGA